MKPLVALFTLALWLFHVGPAAASCVMPLPDGKAVKEADIVFVGTVTETTNANRWATVEVEEVWKGEDIAAVVQIKAGPADPPGRLSAASSVDRTFKEGVRYLFFPYLDKRRGLTDSSCSNTTRFTPAHERFRPASLDKPTAGEDPDDDDAGTPIVLLGAATVVVLVLGGVVLARRRP